jgi:acetylornithine deacetylase/succinyl-diaminopimelate desuccinylase-like protein
MITADGLERRLADLDAVGVGSAGFTRLAWTEEDEACRAWFARQAESAGLRATRDPAGNLWACPEDAPAPWWAAELIPAGMVLVRNPSGISHSPDEQIDLEDAALAARLVQRTLAAQAR